HGWLCLSNSFYWRWLIAAFLSLVLCLGDGMLGRTAGADDVSEGVSKGKHRRDDDDRGDENLEWFSQTRLQASGDESFFRYESQQKRDTSHRCPSDGNNAGGDWHLDNPGVAKLL